MSMCGTLFFIIIWLFGFRLKTSLNTPISASKIFLFITFSQLQKLINFCNLLQGIATSIDYLNIYFWQFNYLIYHFPPIITKPSIFKQSHKIFFSLCTIIRLIYFLIYLIHFANFGLISASASYKTPS